MLGDTTEKSKNPLKKAMRRRNTKTVQFTAPTYVEASEYEYSTEEEDEEDSEVFGNGHVQIEEVQDEDRDDDAIAVEPLRIGSKDKQADELDANQQGEERALDKPEDAPEQRLCPSPITFKSLIGKLTIRKWTPRSRATARSETPTLSSKMIA